MGDGCTDCGRKGGCDHRKQGMFAAIDEALARLYPTRRWAERQELAGVRPAAIEAPVVAERLAARLGTLAVHVPGGVEEYCDYVYVLCLGRTPSLVEVREKRASARELLTEAPAADADDAGGVSELYLRVALSWLAPFAAVQQVTMQARLPAATADSGEQQLLIEEHPRTGVFDPVLLPRFQALVAVLTELELAHLDFGEIASTPDGFDGDEYAARYGGLPSCANYLFYPQPPSSITTTAVALSGEGRI